jgi:hypothetical protein
MIILKNEKVDKLDTICFKEIMSEISKNYEWNNAYIGICLPKNKNEKLRIVLGIAKKHSPSHLKYYVIDLDDEDIEIFSEILKFSIYGSNANKKEKEDIASIYNTVRFLEKFKENAGVIKENKLFEKIETDTYFLQDVITSIKYENNYVDAITPYSSIFLFLYDRKKGKENVKERITKLDIFLFIHELKEDLTFTDNYLFFTFTNDAACKETYFNINYYNSKYRASHDKYDCVFEKYKEKRKEGIDRLIDYFKYFNLSESEISAYKLKEVLN